MSQVAQVRDDEAQTAVVDLTEDKENAQMHLMAKLAAKRLSDAYPHHLWMVGWAPGLTLVVKHMLGDNRYGFTVDAARCASISEFEHLVVMAGGELLERLGLPRGAWNGDMPTQNYEGVRAQDEHLIR